MELIGNFFKLELKEGKVVAERVQQASFADENELFKHYATLEMKYTEMKEFIENYPTYVLEAKKITRGNADKQEKELKYLQHRKIDAERNIPEFEKELQIYDKFINDFFAEPYMKWHDDAINKLAETILK